MIVYVMQGIPGAGKTRWVESQTKGLPDNSVKVVSSDFFFKKLGKYDRSRIQEAHEECLRSFVEAVQKKKFQAVYVDNTNTKVEEAAPYMALAAAYGYKAKIVRVVAHVQAAYQRNVHNVPLEVIKEHAERLSKFKGPGRWRLELVQEG